MVAALFLGSLGLSAADNDQSAAPEKKKETPPTHTVKPGALKFKTELNATVEATEMSPISLTPEAWMDLSIIDVVPHGKKVTKGETLIQLDTEKLEKQIEELEQQQPATKVALELAEAELENLDKTTPLKLEAAKRSNRVSGEDYDYFEKTGRAQREKGVRFGVKRAENYLENAQEELNQLKKMYEADDLTEETEEIILKRQKFEVESAERSLESVRLNAEQSLTRSIPREHESLLSQKRDQELALELAEQTLNRNLTKKRLEVAKLKRDRETADQKLAELKKDLKLLRVRAPRDGIVYYGSCDQGKWTTGPAVSKKLVPGGKLAPREVVMTVVNPELVRLRAVAPENALARLKAGLSGTASPVSAPGKQLDVKLQTINYVPLVTGGFDTSIALEKHEGIRLLPGMTCQVTFKQTGDGEQLLAPKESVFEEAGDSYVYLYRKEGKPEKRAVKTGDADDKMVEVREGLTQGDQILLKKPE